MDSSRLLASRFELTRVAHSGGMGQLFAGLDRQTGEAVAIKMALPVPGASERLSWEARTLALLDHPSVVRYVAHGETSNALPYLVMEWLDGESLAGVLERGPLPVQDVIEIGTRGAAALAHIHSRDLIHRDFSPANIVLRAGRADHAKLVDFGVALPLRESPSEVKFVGSPSYASPEQAAGVAELDPRADLFSLGAVLYEAITGKVAFDGKNALAVLAKVALSEPDFRSLSSLAPSGLCQLVRALLRKSRDDRPLSANHVAEMLAELSFARPSLRSSRHEVSAVTTAERRLVTVVVARQQSEPPTPFVPQPSLASDALVAAIDGKSTALAFLGRGSASDQARHAVRLAADLAETGPVAVASGWANLADDNAVPSEWIDRSVQLLAEVSGEVRLDETTAGLVSSHVTVEAVDTCYRLSRDSEPPRGSARRAAPLLGRERELRTLRAVIADALETPRALAVLVSGPAGIGKSKLAQEFYRELSSTDSPPQLVQLSADPLRANSPLALAHEFVRELLGLRQHASPTERVAEIAEAIESLNCPRAAQTTDFLCETLGLGDGLVASHELAAARQDPVLMGDQIKAALTRLVETLCSRHPVVVGIDDLHWVDGATLQLLDDVLRAALDLPFAIVGLTRPELHDRLPDLWRSHDLQEIRVTELTRRASRRLVAHLLAGEGDEAEVEWMVETAAGNAFYLEELVRAHRAGRGRDVPRSVVAMVQNRLEDMEPEARRVLRGASVFGTHFWPAGVVALVGGDVVENDVAAWLSTLEERELVEASAESRLPDQPEYQFRHALIRDAAYATLTDPDRCSAHMSAAQWLEAAGESDASTLAEHYELGGQPEAAGPFWHRAAVLALEGNDFAAAAMHADRGLASSTNSALTGALLSSAAEAERLRGDLSRAAFLSARALEILERGSGRWFACVGERALVLQRLGSREELCELALQLLDTSPLPGASENAIWAKLRTALACFRVGESSLARSCWDEVAELPELSSPLVFAWRHAVAAIFALSSGDRGEYLQEAQACRARYEQIGDRRAVLEQSINLGSAYVELGRVQQAEQMLRAALVEAKQLHLEHLTAGAQHNLGLALGRMGRFEEALALEHEALANFQRHDRRLEGGARVSMALIALWAQDYELGHREAELGLAMLRSAAPPLVPVALATLAAVELARGRASAALAGCVEAEELVRAAGGIEYGESLLALTHVKALIEQGNVQAAKRIATTASQRLVERARRLTDPALRTSFLQDVPENQQLRRLASELEAP